MTVIFICQIVFWFSIFGIIFLFLRNFPLLADFEPETVSKEDTFSFRIKKKYNNFQKKFKESFNRWQEKNLHRIRLWILKLDNSLTAQLDKIRKQRIHFSRRQRKQKKENNIEK